MDKSQVKKDNQNLVSNVATGRRGSYEEQK